VGQSIKIHFDDTTFYKINQAILFSKYNYFPLLWFKDIRRRASRPMEPLHPLKRLTRWIGSYVRGTLVAWAASYICPLASYLRNIGNDFFFLRIISPQTRGQTRGHSSGPNQDAVVPGTTTDRWLRITTFGQSASILTGVASLTFTKLVQRSRKPRDQLHALSIISGNQMCAPIIASQLQWDVQTQESVRKSEKFFHTAFPERKNVYCKTRALNQ